MEELIIVGAGPAGLTAAIYATRYGIRTKVVTLDIGGQLNLARKIENYPGFLEIRGSELAKLMYEQALKSGASFCFEEVKGFERIEEGFLVRTNKAEHKCKALILAFGRTPRKLGCKGEEKLLGKGVSYCATCDMPLFENKVVVVVGGGNAAFDAALYGSELASKVYLVHRRREFRAFPSLVDEVRKKENVELVLDSVVEEIRGKDKVESVVIKNLATNELREIACDGVFIEIGSEVKRELVEGFVKLNERGEIVINELCETFCPESEEKLAGCFAAGDVASTLLKQIVVACSTGAIAATSAATYLLKS